MGHGGGAVLGKELDDGAADDGTIADFNALNQESQWVEEKRQMKRFEIGENRTAGIELLATATMLGL